MNPEAAIQLRGDLNGKTRLIQGEVKLTDERPITGLRAGYKGSDSQVRHTDLLDRLAFQPLYESHAPIRSVKGREPRLRLLPEELVGLWLERRYRGGTSQIRWQTPGQERRGQLRRAHVVRDHNVVVMINKHNPAAGAEELRISVPHDSFRVRVIFENADLRC